MIQDFIDRKWELSALEEEWKRSGARFAVIYGRRRVGKTEIVHRFLKGKWGVYYLADRRGERSNMVELQRAIEESGVKDFSLYSFDGWVSLFRKLAELVGNRRFTLVIDEFPNLVESDTLSQFQKAWDLYLSKSEIFLILIGSSISMMERMTLDYSSPLYGRRTMQLRVEKLKFWDAWKFLPKYNIKDFLAIFGVTDGIPYYLLQMDPLLPWEENVKRNALSKERVLYEEAEFLLRMELREFRRYYPILEVIADGRGKFNDIAAHTGLDSATLSKYLRNLREIGIVEERFPVFGGQKNRRYVLSDNYFNFYFAFIKPYRRFLEIGEIENAWNRMRDSYLTYLGRVFEEVVRDYFSRIHPEMVVGSWWNRKGDEIDIVAVDRKRRRAYLGEVKIGKSLGRRDVDRLQKLRDQIKGLGNFDVKYVLVAPRVNYTGEDVISITMDDLAREMRNFR